jgi:hypothetical protein
MCESMCVYIQYANTALALKESMYVCKCMHVFHGYVCINHTRTCIQVTYVHTYTHTHIYARISCSRASPNTSTKWSNQTTYIHIHMHTCIQTIRQTHPHTTHIHTYIHTRRIPSSAAYLPHHTQQRADQIKQSYIHTYTYIHTYAQNPFISSSPPSPHATTS